MPPRAWRSMSDPLANFHRVRSGIAALQHRSRALGGLGAEATGGASSVTTYGNYAKAIYQAIQGDAVGGAVSAATTLAGPLAAIGFAIAGFLNRGKQRDDEIAQAFLDSLVKDVGFGQLLAGKAGYRYLTPDGTVLLNPNSQMLAAARAIANGVSADAVGTAFKAWLNTGTPYTPSPVLKMLVAPRALAVAAAAPPAILVSSAPSLLTPVSVASATAPSSVRSSSVPTSADQRAKAQALSSLSGASLLSAYGQIAGSVPGRFIGVPTLEKVIDAIGQAGQWPNVKKWGSGIVDQVVMTGGKGITPPTMIDWVKQKVAAGQMNPVALVSEWGSLVNSTWGSKWLVPSGELQRQCLIDMLDALIAQVNPSAPLYYAQATETVATPSPTPVPQPAPSPSPSPISPTPITPITQLPSPTPGQPPINITLPPAPTSATDPNMAAYLKALQDQGASQQQAFQAAMQALANAGQAVTPQVQQAVADTVQATAPPQQASTLYLALGAAAIIGFGILMGRRKGRK